jgi:SAM-dependent methyltransferase
MTNASWPRRLHALADRIDRRCGSLLRITGVTERAWIAILDAIVASQSDRRYLRRAIFPALARRSPRRLLFVGVRGYTARYAASFEAAGVEYWTCDIDPDAGPHGAPGRHRRADVCRLDETFSRGFFDCVVMNGVFGWGVDNPEDMNRALGSAHAVLAPGGLLLLGWNGDRSADPDTLPAIRHFEPIGFGGLPARKTFTDVTHIYAWYKARSVP